MLALIIKVHDLKSDREDAFAFAPGRVLVGRSGSAELVIPTDTLAEVQGAFDVSGDRVTYSDLDPKNDTILNGKPIETARAVALTSLSELIVGGRFRLQVKREAVEAVPPPPLHFVVDETTILPAPAPAPEPRPLPGAANAPSGAATHAIWPGWQMARADLTESLPPPDEAALPRTAILPEAAAGPAPGASALQAPPPQGPLQAGESIAAPVRGGPLALGTVLFGRYKIKKLLGMGGMGAVYAAHDARLNRKVAIKTLLAAMATHKKSYALFEQEAQALACIDSLALVEVYDLFVEDAIPYLVMELLKGRELGALLREQGQLDVAQTAAVATGICAGVAAAHDQDLVHRDLKPNNVFLAETEHGEIPKVLDFGVAKVVGFARATASSAVVGTAGYMSPEQAGGRSVGKTSDQYSIGVILYECVTGRLPYNVTSPYEMMKSIVEGQLRPPSVYCPTLPEEFEAIIMRALELDPAKRFPSVHDLGAALLSFASEDARRLWTSVYAKRSRAGEKPARSPMVSERAEGPPLRGVTVSSGDPLTTFGRSASVVSVTFQRRSRGGLAALILGGAVCLGALSYALWPRSKPTISSASAGAASETPTVPVERQDDVELRKKTDEPEGDSVAEPDADRSLTRGSKPPASQEKRRGETDGRRRKPISVPSGRPKRGEEGKDDRRAPLLDL